jgi:hypothetical protein
MSDKKLLTESEIRRFMRLANLEPLAGRVVKENTMPEEGMGTYETEVKEGGGSMMGHGDVAGGGAESDVLEYDLEEEMLGGEGEESGMGGMSPEVMSALENLVKAVTGQDVKLEVEEDGEDSMAAPEKSEVDGDDEEEEDEGEEDMEDMKEVEESLELSEDDLVETVLNRVTARLVAEAKKKKLSAKDKKAAAQRMKDKAMAAAKKKKMTKEAVDSKGGGPLINKGGYKGGSGAGWEKAEDMAYGKGEKGGKGGHTMEKVTAKAEHTISHGKTNLATKGSVK